MILNTALKIASIIVMLQLFASAKSYLGPTKLKNKTVNHLSITGPATLKNVTAQSLSVTGPLKFEALRVTEDTKITGPVEKSNDGHFANLTITGPSKMDTMSCHKLSVTGPMTLTNAHVHDDATLIGCLTTTRCTFKGIIITADKIELKDTQTKNIIVKKNNPGSGFFSWFFDFFGFNSPQERQEVMTLSGNTTIKGDLTFESNKGHLIIMPGAEVTGIITGATIERK